MKTNKSLTKAKKIKNDEFYTLWNDVANEVSLYKDQLKGKRILCPCDWDESYNEEFVYKEESICKDGEGSLSKLLTKGTIKHINIKASKKKIEKDLDLIKCNFIKFLVSHADTYESTSISASGYDPATGKGVRFQDIDYSKYDIVITNPPFSQFREFITVMMKNKMKFLIIGPKNAITYKDVFKYIKANKIWLGYNCNLTNFLSLDHKPITAPAYWYTNLDVSRRNDRMILTEIYDPKKYPKYDNYDAINVDRTKDIPSDYNGAMGVPISFLTKYNQEQFNITGMAEDNGRGFSGGIWDGKNPHCVINGQNKFKRIFIKNKRLIKKGE